MGSIFTTRGGRGWLVGVPPPRKAVVLTVNVRDEPTTIDVRATLEPEEARRLSAALLKAAKHAAES
jgi:hypothetical protein